ncbi:MAG: hypothetical protein ACE14W_02575 [Candidatus Velamenicoccus archaeovorus]
MGRETGWARATGLLIGLAVAVVAVRSWTVAPGHGGLGADLLMATAPTGELAVSVTGPFLSATGMVPGSEADAAAGTFDVYNRTAATLAIRLQARPSVPDMNDLLWVEVDAGADRVYRGPLASLVEGSPDGFRLAPTEDVTLTVRSWLPRSSGDGYRGRVVTVDWTFLPTPVEGSR